MNTLNPWPWPVPPVGVYFNMPHDTYLDIPALSNSGIKDLLIAAPNFWAQSWLNPFKKRKDKKHFRDGHAYHHRILFGKEYFYQAYAAEFEAPDDAISGNKPMQEALKAIGVSGTSGKTAAELAAMMAQHLPQKKCAHNLEQEYLKTVTGKTLLPADVMREIELSAKAIECNHHMNHWLMGGYPEVTVIWQNKYGFMCKARFDYMKIGYISDLKTIANERGRRFDKAVDYAIAGNKYFIQSAWYLEAAEAARELITYKQIHGANDVGVSDNWLTDFAKTPISQFRFIFQQKDMALVTLGRTHSTSNKSLMEQGAARIDSALRSFMAYYNAFGKDVWFSTDKPQEIDTESLPAFMGDL